MASSASEALRPLVHAVELDRLGQVQGRLEHLVGDQLRHDHGHAHRQPRRARGPALHGLLQLAAEAEDLVRVAVDGAADVGEDHGAPGADEQLLPERLLQLPELAADRGLRDVELLARPRHAAFADHRPEMEEVVMVEHRPRHDDTSKRALWNTPRNRYWTAAAASSLDCGSRERELRNHAAAGTLRIDVTSAGLVLTKALRGEVRRRVLLAMSRFGPEVHGVTARLAESRNPLGGVDQRCRVRARLQSGLVLRAEAINGRIETAVGRSVDRLALHIAAALDGGGARSRRGSPAPQLMGRLASGASRSGASATRRNGRLVQRRHAVRRTAVVPLEDAADRVASGRPGQRQDDGKPARPAHPHLRRPTPARPAVPDEDLADIAAQPGQQAGGLLLGRASRLDLVDDGVDDDQALRRVRQAESELLADESHRSFGELRRGGRRDLHLGCAPPAIIDANHHIGPSSRGIGR